MGLIYRNAREKKPPRLRHSNHRTPRATTLSLAHLSSVVWDCPGTSEKPKWMAIYLDVSHLGPAWSGSISCRLTPRFTG
ncbi:hypothetical protein DTO217A2_587 [Paecilomyces variotii]|nr:hypothetical protein DTO217A2_587 [Paecilomyces variotii]